MTTFWNTLNLLFLLTTITGLVLLFLGGAVGLRSVLLAGEPSRFLLKRTLSLLGRLSWLFLPLLIWIVVGIWLGQEQGIWRTLISLIAPATILGWILLSVLWREQLQPGALFAVWLSEETSSTQSQTLPKLSTEEIVSMDLALQKVRTRSLDLSTESLVKTLRESLQAAQSRTGRTTLFERMDTNIWFYHLQELCRDLRNTVSKAPLVQNFTLAELQGEGTLVGLGLLRAQRLVEYGRLFLNPLWLLENFPFWRYIKGHPTQVAYQELTCWLHAEIYRLTFHRMLHMYREQDLAQQPHPSNKPDSTPEEEHVLDMETTPSGKPVMQFRREALRTWGFFWSFALLPVSLYTLLSAVCVVFVYGWKGMLVSLAVLGGVMLMASRVLALTPWAQWLQSLAKMEAPSSSRVTLHQEWAHQVLTKFRQDIWKHPEVGTLGMRQWGKSMSVALQEAWNRSAQYVAEQRPRVVNQHPALHFYLPDGFRAIELAIADLQDLYNSDNTVANVFRWLNRVGYNPHLDSLGQQLNPEPPSSSGLNLGSLWKKVVQVAKKVPHPYISGTAHAIEAGADMAAVWGQEWWHQQSVKFVVETWGWRMMQLFAHNLPFPETEPPSSKELDPAIESLRFARKKTAPPTDVPVVTAEEPVSIQPLLQPLPQQSESPESPVPAPVPGEQVSSQPQEEAGTLPAEPGHTLDENAQEIQNNTAIVVVEQSVLETKQPLDPEDTSSLSQGSRTTLHPQLAGLLAAKRNKKT